MLTVTEPASVFLADILSQQELPEDVAVRFVVEQNGIAMRPDNERPGDTTFEHSGRTILLLDEQMSGMLANQTLDLEQAGEQPRLALREAP